MVTSLWWFVVTSLSKIFFAAMEHIFKTTSEWQFLCIKPDKQLHVQSYQKNCKNKLLNDVLTVLKADNKNTRTTSTHHRKTSQLIWHRSSTFTPYFGHISCISYRNQSLDLLCNSNCCFLYEMQLICLK